VTRPLAALLPILFSSGCYLFKSASVDETCEDTPDGCGDAEVDDGDADGDGFTEEDGDCDDGNADIHPDADDIPDDGIDQDCDGADAVGLTDADGDGFYAEEDDCDDTNADIHPDMDELCATPGVDDDCDGLVDDEDDIIDGTTWYADGDIDGYGNAGAPAVACEPPESYVADNTDCDDRDDAVNPGAREICNNGVDDNCNSSADACAWSGRIDPGDGTGVWLYPSGASTSYGFDIEDITGDGVPDGILGVPYSTEWPNGAAVIMDRPPVGVGTVRAASAGAVVVGDTSTGGLGRSLEGIPDVTADGYADLIVSDSDGLFHLLEGPVTSGWVGGAHTHFVGLKGSYETKGTLAADLDGDGQAELIVGFSDAESHAGDDYPGRLIVREGPISSGTIDITSRAQIDLEGPESGSLLGYAAIADDFDGDGIDELAIAAPFATGDGAFGGAVALIDDGSRITDFWDADGYVFGEVDSAFGAELASGDLDGDGQVDLAASAVWEAVEATAYGATYVVGSFADDTLTVRDAWASVSATGTDAFLGYAVEIGQTDGLPGNGLVVGIPQQYSSDVGAVAGFHTLPPGAHVSTDADFAIVGDAATTSFSYDLALIDMNGDGIDDLFTTTGDHSGVGYYPLSGL